MTGTFTPTQEQLEVLSRTTEAVFGKASYAYVMPIDAGPMMNNDIKKHVHRLTKAVHKYLNGGATESFEKDFVLGIAGQFYRMGAIDRHTNGRRSCHSYLEGGWKKVVDHVSRLANDSVESLFRIMLSIDRCHFGDEPAVIAQDTNEKPEPVQVAMPDNSEEDQMTVDQVRKDVEEELAKGEATYDAMMTAMDLVESVGQAYKDEIATWQSRLDVQHGKNEAFRQVLAMLVLNE